MNASARALPLLSLAALLLSGCSSQIIPGSPGTGATLAGKVHGGQQPVAGATIQLYAAGTATPPRYTPLLKQPVASAADGTFNITQDYVCPAGALVYLTATGGSPGTGVANPNLALLTVLGPCGALTPSTSVQINEVTTVAGVAALAPYMTSFDLLGSADASGLAASFALAAQFADSSTGSSPGSAPAATSIPSTLINTLADVIAACINSNGGAAGDGSPCGQLFALSAAGGAPLPTDTVSALINLANHPTVNTSALFALIPPSAPFQPVLSTPPPDFAIHPSYPAGQSGLQFSVPSLVFPITATGTTSAPLSVTLTNANSAAVTVSSILLAGMQASEFTQTNNCPTSLQSGGSCVVQLTVKPTAIGARDAFLEIQSSAQPGVLFLPLSVSNPVPAITSLSPGSTLAGATQSVSVYGTNLLPSSLILVNGAVRPTSHLYSGQLSFTLSALDVAAPGSLSITVLNPLPGGGSSAVRLFTVRTPAAPTISFIYTDPLYVNSPDTPEAVQGTNLTQATVVEWNGVPLVTPPYGFASSTQRFFTVPANLLTTPGTAVITLYDPTSTPQRSAPVTVTIAYPPAPKINVLSDTPNSANVVTAGPFNTSTPISFLGAGFTLASTITVNGVPVPSTVSSNTSISATLSPLTLATPGLYNIGVTTAGPGGGVAAPVAYTAYIPLLNNSMVYNSANGLFYASVPGVAGPPYGNSIVSIDPATGALGTPIYVGSEPNKLAITADGNSLWVGLDGSGSVRLVNLATGTAGLQFATYGVVTDSEPLTVGALAALPGSPTSVVVSTNYASPAIYDNGVLRGGNPAACFRCVSSIQTNSANSEIYAASSYALTIYTASSTGLTAKSTFSSPTGGFVGDAFNIPSYLDEFQVASGKIFTDFGTVYDSETAALLGTFYNPGYSNGTYRASGPTITDVTVGKTFILDSTTINFNSFYQIQVFDPGTYAPLSSPPINVTVPSTTGGSANPYPSRLFRWGSNGLAFRTASYIFSLRSNSVTDLAGTNADLGVTITASGPQTTGSNTTYLATVTNTGPAAATNIAFAASLPAGSVLVSAASASGSCTSANTVMCSLGGLASAQSATVTLVVTQLASGPATLTATVTASENDPAPANNLASSTLNISGATYNPAPAISAINPAAIQSGHPNTLITVTGSGFTNSSSILLGGSAIPTQFVSATKLTASISYAQLPTLGWTTVAVQNPAPGGATSNPLPLTIFTVLPAGANHILFDPYSRKIMTSIGAGTPTLAPNSLAALTPETATFSTPVPIGPSPTKMALSPDGQALYTILSTTNSIARFNMLTQQLDFTVPLASTYAGRISSVRDLAVQPGTEDTLALDLGDGAGTGLFDFNVAARSAALRGSGTTFYNTVCPQFLNATDLYETDFRPTNLYHFTVPGGGFLQTDYGQAPHNFVTNIGCPILSGNIAWGSTGGVASLAAPIPVQIGQFQPAVPVAFYSSLQNGVPDTSLGTSFFLSNIYNLCCIQAQGIAVYDQKTFLLKSLVDLHIPAIEGASNNYTSVDLIRWGQDGLAALLSTGDLYLLRGPLVVPQLLNTNSPALLTSTSAPTLPHGTGNTDLSLTGSNFLPGVAVLWNGAYRTTTLVDATHLSLAIPATDLASPGVATITAANPGAAPSPPITILIN